MDEMCPLIFHPLGPFIRWQGFSEELFMSQMRRPETMKMDFAHG
jgi:hypothetical protein